MDLIPQQKPTPSDRAKSALVRPSTSEELQRIEWILLASVLVTTWIGVIVVAALFR